MVRPSPLEACLKLNVWAWQRLPEPVTTLAPLRSYGRFVHRLVQARAERRQFFGTFFFRNRPALALLRRLGERAPVGSTWRVAFLACSNGAEMYSALWTVRTARPDLKVVAHAVDVSPEMVEIARRGTYALEASDVVGERIFSRTTTEEMSQMFEVDRRAGVARIEPWLQEGIAWHVADAGAPDIVDRLGPQDTVMANNFLCHMRPVDAERCLRNVARLVAAGGHLMVSGIDLDVRTRVAVDLGWQPVGESLAAVHDGDQAVRRDWPCAYWGLEPLDGNRPDFAIRYASVFRLGGRA